MGNTEIQHIYEFCVRKKRKRSKCFVNYGTNETPYRNLHSLVLATSEEWKDTKLDYYRYRRFYRDSQTIKPPHF